MADVLARLWVQLSGGGRELFVPIRLPPWCRRKSQYLHHSLLLWLGVWYLALSEPSLIERQLCARPAWGGRLTQRV